MKNRGFSLLELIVSMAVMSILVLILASATNHVQKTLFRTQKKVETFRETRSAFEAMARRIGQATLNNYWGYDNPSLPEKWLRHSELHFVSLPLQPYLSQNTPGHGVFFQAPFGYAGSEAKSTGNPDLDFLDGLLNGWGYYVDYTSDLDQRTPFLRGETSAHPERKRFRLMEFRLASEDLNLYTPRDITGEPAHNFLTNQTELYRWFTDANIRANASRPIAENVVALIISPNNPETSGHTAGTGIAPEFVYDSRRFQWEADSTLAQYTRHQLPPTLDIALVATNELSWQRFEQILGNQAHTQLLDQVNERFQNPDTLDSDLETLEQWMLEHHLEPRVFKTTVAIRGAKFSTTLDPSGAVNTNKEDQPRQ